MPASSLLRKASKAAVLPLGVFDRTRAGDLVILLYHRVGAGDREIDLEREAFESQMAYLAATGEVRSLDEALNGGGVVVTIDDGYRDFHDHALPALERHRVPALLYLATGLVDGEEQSEHGDGLPLTWSQLAEAVCTGLVTIGAHTHRHANLSRASEEVAEEEMRRSRKLVEDRLGVSCRHFAYPWAVASPAAERAARRLFDTAALLWATNRRGRIDRYRLGRTPVLRADGPSFFRAKVQGKLDKEAVLYRAFRRGPWRQG